MMRVKIIDGIYGCRSAKYGVNPVYAGEECEVSGHRYRAPRFYELCFKIITPIGVTIVLIGQIMDFFM